MEYWNITKMRMQCGWRKRTIHLSWGQPDAGSWQAILYVDDLRWGEIRCELFTDDQGRPQELWFVYTPRALQPVEFTPVANFRAAITYFLQMA